MPPHPTAACREDRRLRRSDGASFLFVLIIGAHSAGTELYIGREEAGETDEGRARER